jgi:signal transduction histidine kinase
MKSFSLTRRLIVTVLLVESCAALAISAMAFVYERHERFHAFEIMLRGRADSLLGAVQDAEDANDNVMLDGSEVNLPAEDIYLVEDANGRVLGHSPNWNGPEPRLRAAEAGKPVRLNIHRTHYRAIRIEGLRIVDPGDKGGGIPRHVTIFYGSPSDGVWDTIWRAVGFYALTSVALLAISGSFIFWLMDRGLAPLRELAAAADRVSVDSWNFVPPPRARMVKELAPLAVALETALARLERSFLEQRRFVSDAAHELKTAVAVQKSSLQLLALKQRTVAEYERGIERCQLDCGRLEEAVAKMLTLARLETPVESPSSASADLAQCVRRVAEQYASMAELRRQRIIVNAGQAVIVNVEPEQLELLCSNLLLNAIQHSPEGADIRAVVQQDGELVMEDDGDGIAAEDLPHVFDRFYRGDPSRSRNTGGTGLGLAIGKAIVTRFQGTISIDSEPHVGTRVRVRFPRAKASQEGQAFMPAELHERR